LHIAYLAGELSLQRDAELARHYEELAAAQTRASHK
jgi:hypothetical protein